MALPVPTKTWQHNVNQAIASQGSALANNRRILRTIKDTLKGFSNSPWTVRYSCDSVTAGTVGDGVDRWDSDTDLVFAASSSVAHSWIVLRQVGINGAFEICIELLANVSAPRDGGYGLKLIVSPGGLFTGGNTTTVRPAATDELVVDLPNPWTNLQSDLSSRLSVSQSSDGQCTRIWGAANGAVTFLWLFDKPSVIAEWTNPNYVYAGSGSHLTSGAPPWATTNGRARVNSISSNAMLGSESAGNAFLPTDGSAGTIANELSGQYPITTVNVVTTTVGARGRHGTLVDLWYGSTAVPSGDTYQPDGTNQFVQVGALVLPWNGGAVNLS